MPSDDAYRETSPAFYGQSQRSSESMDAFETADFLGLALPTVIRMAKSGKIPAHRAEVITGVGRGHRLRQRWSFDREELEEWIESCRIEPGTLLSGKVYPRPT